MPSTTYLKNNMIGKLNKLSKLIQNSGWYKDKLCTQSMPTNLINSSQKQCCVCSSNDTSCAIQIWVGKLNTLRPRQDGRHFPDDILKCNFLNENVWISLTISLKCVRKVRIYNIPSLVQILAWRRPGDKPLSEPMMVSLLTHICVTRLQWV